MKFSQIPYQRPDLGQLRQHFHDSLQQFEQAATAGDQLQVIRQLYLIRSHFETMSNVAAIRHTVDTTDKVFEAEQQFFDNSYPVYTGLVSDFYRALLSSKFRDELEAQLGLQLFRIADLTLKSFKPEVIQDMQRENELSTEYTNLIASAQVEFQGGQYNLSGMVPFKLSPDRSVRKSAHEKTDEFFIKQAPELDRIFSELVNVRHRIAQKLGYRNFVEVGYMRMFRTDYGAGQVKHFRDLIKEKIVPLVTGLKDRQRQRLGLDQLWYYDEPLDFPGGNAVPKGKPEWIIERARQMYEELSPETGAFFRYMMDNELMDLVNKPNKAGGGYCTFLSEPRSPFIFSNFNGTSHDIDVLTHEAGHAFQTYCSRHLEVEEYFFPTSEAAEIHSMSMEFLTWPWMHLFFNGETEKYRYAHLSHAITFLPYGVAVDEFQHFVYEHPLATPKERNEHWRSLEIKYLPHRTYENNDYLGQGGYWQRQSHIYKTPFYYIDYTLAQICAFQFWKKAGENNAEAMQDYIRLCREGGSKSFLELVQVAGLKSPFEDAAVTEAVDIVDQWLQSVSLNS